MALLFENFLLLLLPLEDRLETVPENDKNNGQDGDADQSSEHDEEFLRVVHGLLRRLGVLVEPRREIRTTCPAAP